MKYKTRELKSGELKFLKTLKTQAEKKGRSKSAFYPFILALSLGIIFAYFAIIIGKDGFWRFLSGSVAVFSFSFVVFMPYEIYKAQREHKKFLQRLNALIEKGAVDTCQISATRIALAKEYEDENDLYIAEIDRDKVLYLWDMEYNLSKIFPCLQFEIYDDDFFKLTGRQIFPLSEKTKPVMILPKKKWKYLKQMDLSEHWAEPLPGAPDSVSTENISFDELINEMNAQ